MSEKDPSGQFARATLGRYLLGHNTFTLCLLFFNLGFLFNAVIRKISMDVWPPDTMYPLIGFVLTATIIGIQFVVRCSLKRNQG